MCKRCYLHDPGLPFRVASYVAERLDSAPDGFEDFVGYVAARHCPARAETMIRKLGKVLDAGPLPPGQALERITDAGQVTGSLALALAECLVEWRLMFAPDRASE